MKLTIIFFGIFYSIVAQNVYAGSVVSEVPAEPDAAEKYIFYLHGSVEESEGENDKYVTAVEAIAESSAMVISEVRGETEPNIYAQKIKGYVEFLI